ncbi:MAG: hypothetical protein GOV15_00305 [Candidatus Diapherotrites archaeon]|nr:hypothetical protein [Candidatus Diapherotrites archaeon]
MVAVRKFKEQNRRHFGLRESFAQTHDSMMSHPASRFPWISARKERIGSEHERVGAKVSAWEQEIMSHTVESDSKKANAIISGALKEKLATLSPGERARYDEMQGLKVLNTHERFVPLGALKQAVAGFVKRRYLVVHTTKGKEVIQAERVEHADLNVNNPIEKGTPISTIHGTDHNGKSIEVKVKHLESVIIEPLQEKEWHDMAEVLRLKELSRGRVGPEKAVV